MPLSIESNRCPTLADEMRSIVFRADVTGYSAFCKHLLRAATGLADAAFLGGVRQFISTGHDLTQRRARAARLARVAGDRVREADDAPR